MKFRITGLFGLALTVGCTQDPNVALDRTACMSGMSSLGADEETPLGWTPGQAVAPWNGFTWHIVWRDESAPLPSELSSTIQGSAAQAETIEWLSDDGCPATPSVSVVAPIALADASETLAADGQISLEWFDVGPPEGSNDGSPWVGAEITATTPIETWAHGAIEATYPELTLTTLRGIGLTVDEQRDFASIDATFVLSDGSERNFPREEIPEFWGDLTSP